MESETREVSFSLTADAAVRKGAYANLLGIRTSNKEAVLDFGFLDDESINDEGVLVRSGVLNARVIVTFDTLVEFRDALSAHIEANLVKVEK